MSIQTWSASAPGKVLICGGYLIVEPGNEGLSIGVSARFTSKVTKASAAAMDATTANSSSQAIQVAVNSPQFGKTFEYLVSQESSGDVSPKILVKQTQGPGSPFLHKSVLYSFAHLVSQSRVDFTSSQRRIEIDLLADNPFYSQRNYLAEKGLPVTVENLRNHVPPHQPLVGEVSKTGLGSSAALTTSLVAAIHNQFGYAVSGSEEEQEQVHRVAQLAHCIAQGKIGSGFDVYTAVYGTCVYSRFNPTVIQNLMKSHKGELQEEEGLAKYNGDADSVFLDLLKPSLRPSDEDLWVKPRPFSGLPQGFHLLLADVHKGGSETPGMVSKIMAWKNSMADKTIEEGNLWLNQKVLNQRYLHRLENLPKLAEATAEDDTEPLVSYQQALNFLSKKSFSDWKFQAAAVVNEGLLGNSTRTVDEAFDKRATEPFLAITETARAAQDCRSNLKAIGEKADVEVEPDVLTPLLDATLALPGVFAVGCPGAGGFDALFAIVIEGEGTNNCGAVEQFWESQKELSVCPLIVREDPNGGLTSKQNK